MKVEIRKITPTDKRTKRLFELLDTHNMEHCPPEECHLTQPYELEKADSILFGIFCNNTLCGMGALILHNEYAEVSRMFVLESYRGRGLATRLLEALENEAIKRGKSSLKLETSDRFKHAYRLYLKYGFSLCGPFGEYIHATYQHAYMEKKLA